MNRLWRADWLSADRARAYGHLLGIAVLLFGLAAFGRIAGAAFKDPHWRPIANDFDPFWSGARLALDGHPGAAYDMPVITALENRFAQSGGDIFYYLYPPVWMMLCLPFAALPYLPALLLFEGASTIGLLACVRRLMPAGWPILPLIAFPAAIINAVIGQNGSVSGLCFAGAALLLETRPMLAGACLGMLAYKPQLALCVPLALLAARRFRALVSCGLVAAGLVAASWVILGTVTWRAFMAASPFIASVLRDPGIWPKTISVFAAIRHAGFGMGAAYTVQAASGIVALACAALLCARRPGGVAEISLAIVAAMLATPYLMDYDLSCLAVPLAWLAAQGVQGGFRGGEKMVLLAAYVAPLAARGLSLAAGIPLAPVVLAGLLAILAARTWRHLAAAR